MLIIILKYVDIIAYKKGYNIYLSPNYLIYLWSRFKFGNYNSKDWTTTLSRQSYSANNNYFNYYNKYNSKDSMTRPCLTWWNWWSMTLQERKKCRLFVRFVILGERLHIKKSTRGLFTIYLKSSSFFYTRSSYYSYLQASPTNNAAIM